MTLKTWIERPKQLPEIVKTALQPLWWAIENVQPSPPLRCLAANQFLKRFATGGRIQEKHVHKKDSCILWETPQTPSSHLRTTLGNKIHHQTPKDSSKRHSMSYEPPNIHVNLVWVFGNVCSLVFVGFCCCPKLFLWITL